MWQSLDEGEEPSVSYSAVTVNQSSSSSSVIQPVLRSRVVTKEDYESEQSSEESEESDDSRRKISVKALVGKKHRRGKNKPKVYKGDRQLPDEEVATVKSIPEVDKYVAELLGLTITEISIEHTEPLIVPTVEEPMLSEIPTVCEEVADEPKVDTSEKESMSENPTQIESNPKVPISDNVNVMVTSSEPTVDTTEYTIKRKSTSSSLSSVRQTSPIKERSPPR